MAYEVRICGIPAQVDVIYYNPGSPGYTSGAPEDCYESEGCEIEFNVLDRRGRAAPWLERKLLADKRELARVENEVIDMVEGDAADDYYNRCGDRYNATRRCR